MWLFLQNSNYSVPVYSDMFGSFYSDIIAVICRNKCLLILYDLSQCIPDHFQHKYHKRRAFIETVRFIQCFIIPFPSYAFSLIV